MSEAKYKLKRNHTWKSKPGYSICVLDRSLVRFDYPSDWIVETIEGAVILHDSAQSNESCDVGVSIFRVPIEAIEEMSMDELLMNALGAGRDPRQLSEIYRVQRDDIEIAWIEQRYVEGSQDRAARFRTALARGPVVCLLSMNYWADRAARLEPVWDEILRTLMLGMHINDPTAGPVVH